MSQWRATMAEMALFQSQKSHLSTAPALNCCCFQISHLTEPLNSQIILLLLEKAVLFQTLHQMTAMCQTFHCQAATGLFCSHHLQILAVMADQADSLRWLAVPAPFHFWHFQTFHWSAGLKNCHFH